MIVLESLVTHLLRLTHNSRNSYLELQIHGEIRFDRDVAMMVVSKKEVTGETNKWLREFSKRFGCKVCVFSGNTMRSF